MSSVRNTWVFFAIFLLPLCNATVAADIEIKDGDRASAWRGWKYTWDDDLIAFTSPDERKIAAFSQDANQGWKTFTPENECTLSPIVAKAYLPRVTPYFGDVVALKLVPSEGHPVTTIAVFNIRSGDWVVQELIEPSNETIEPRIANGSIYYQIANRYYAFSALDSSWGVLELDEGAFHRVITSNGLLVVQTPTAVHAFNAREGLWFSIEPDEIENAAAR